MTNTPPPLVPDILGCMFVSLMFLLSLAAFAYTVLFVVTVLSHVLGATI